MKLNSNNNIFFDVELQVIFAKDNDYFIAYCPSLKLTAYAKTQKAVKKKFSEV